MKDNWEKTLSCAIQCKKCGNELAKKVSDEILRKSGRGVLLRRVRVDGISNSAQADYIRVGLAKKPGIQSVTLKNWKPGRAIFWVRLDAGAKENLAAYLEQLENIRLDVKEVEKTGVRAKKPLL